MENAVRKSTLFHEKTRPLVILLVVVSMVTHNTGSVTGNDRIVKRDPRPPERDTMAAMMVVADVMEIPPASIVMVNCKGCITVIDRKKTQRGTIKTSRSMNTAMLYRSLERNTVSADEWSLRNSAVDSSSSRVNTCDSEFMAEKKRMTQRKIACMPGLIAVPPVAKLMERVVMNAKATDTFIA